MVGTVTNSQSLLSQAYQLAIRFACLTLALLVGACASQTPQAKSIQAKIAWVTQGEFCEPETVLPLPDSTLLISNVCGFGSEGDGFLSLLDADGRVIDWRQVDGLDSPLGMAMRDGQIYVVDANQVRSFSWPGFTALGVVELDAVVANDIAVSPDGTLYISDTAAGSVIVLETGRKQSTLASSTAFQGANGMEMGSDGALYVGGTHLWRVDLASGDAERIGPDWLNDIDGIEFEPNGTIQVTPVGGPLIRLRQSGLVEVIEGEGVSSANHGYLGREHLALIPTGFDNTVIAIRVAADGPDQALKSFDDAPIARAGRSAGPQE